MGQLRVTLAQKGEDRMRALVGLLLLGLTLCGAAFAQEAQPQQRLTVDDFFADARLKQGALSPSGRYLAIAINENGKEALAVRDLETGQATALATYDSSQQKGASIRYIHWKSDQRLVFGAEYYEVIRAGGKLDGDVLNIKYGNADYAVNRDGSSLVQLFSEQVGTRLRTSGTGTTVVNVLQNDPDHILMQFPFGRFGLSVHRVNINTGRSQLAETGPATQWFTNKDGKVVARVVYLTTTLRVLETRDPGGTIWRERVRINLFGDNDRPDFSLVGASDDASKLYALVEARGALGGATTELRYFDLRTNKVDQVVFANLDYDITSIVRDPRTSAFVGACYYVDYLQCDYVGEDTRRNMRALSRFFEDSRNIRVVSQSWDNRYWLLDVSGPQDRGTLYRYDWLKKNVEPIGARYPQLPAFKLGVTEAYKYKARDGLALTGYLTVPRTAGKPPLIVMPHGGPTSRDAMEFDLWAQYFGARGYAVFQPNFRGSSGYGRAFEEAGYRQWGGLMQDDITDGVNDLIAKGRVDPQRVCTVGASYGGYAALYGGARQPELYKCVVSIAGVSSLPDLLSETKVIFGMGPAFRTRSAWIGDEREDRQMMLERSPITYAATFKPPLLLYHGRFDERVRDDHSRKMHALVRQGGGDAKLVLYDDEGHPHFSDFHERQMLPQIEAFVAEHIGAPN